MPTSTRRGGGEEGRKYGRLLYNESPDKENCQASCDFPGSSWCVLHRSGADSEVRMSETTTITPAIYYEILKAIRESGNEIEMSVTLAPDGTQAQTIVIRPAAPVVPAQEQVQAPKPISQSKQTRVARPSAPPCTADRCTLSSNKRGPDGYYHMGYIADRMWANQKKKWWQR